MNILITGANGFVGQALCPLLLQRGHAVRGAARSPGVLVHDSLTWVPMGELGAQTDWNSALRGIDAVVHLAARVHVMRDEARDPLATFRSVNTEGTLNLARQAVAAGVRRFVFMSSIKVNGEETFPHSLRVSANGGVGCGFREADEPCPRDAYAISKWEAEQGLNEIAHNTGMDVVILRPPLVYGPGVRANFLRLMQGVEREMPLPFAAIDNRRSLLYLGNLVDAIALCLTHPAAANRTYLVADGEDVSTSELVRRLAAQMGKRVRLWSLPTALLEMAGRLVGKGAEVRRLLSSLVVEGEEIRRELGWQPPYNLDAGLRETVRWYQTDGRVHV